MALLDAIISVAAKTMSSYRALFVVARQQPYADVLQQPCARHLGLKVCSGGFHAALGLVAVDGDPGKVGAERRDVLGLFIRCPRLAPAQEERADGLAAGVLDGHRQARPQADAQTGRAPGLRPFGVGLDIAAGGHPVGVNRRAACAELQVAHGGAVHRLAEGLGQARRMQVLDAGAIG
nr:hypothetical protein [Achromobacter insolitus]